MADTDTAEKPKEDFYSSLSGLSDAMGPVADPMVRLLREKEKSTQTEMEQKASREASSYGGKAAAASQFADAQKQAFKGYENMPARPKDVITQDTQQGLQGLAMLLPVAGLFLGAKGATSGVNAMNAMTGVLTGYKTGNQDRIAFETKKYENSIKEWETNYKIAKDGIDRAIELAKTNYQSGVAAAEAAAHKIGSVELAAMTRNKSLGEIQTIMNKIGQDYQTHKNKLEELTTRQFNSSGLGGLGSTAKLASIFGPELAARTPPKEAEKLVGGLNSIKSTMDLIKKAQDPEIKFGELGRIGVNISAAFGRNLGSDNSELSPQAVSNSIDQAANEAGLSPTDKNVVFYKEAVFTALELERQARGGSILPVAVIKTLTPLLDPRTTTREGYTEILRRRATDVARSTGLSQEQLNSALTKMPSVNIGMPGAMPVAAAPSAAGAAGESDPLGLR